MLPGLPPPGSPEARLVAGATDVGLWVNKQFRNLGDVIYTGRVAALREIRQDGDGVWIGAAATLEDSWAALVTAVPGIRFGLAFCEASGKCLVRWTGTDPAMVELAKNNATAIGKPK